MNLEDLFTLTTLCAAISRLPLQPTLLGDTGLFEEKGINTTSVLVEVKEGRLFLVPNADRNADATPVSQGKRNRRSFEVPHLPARGVLLPGDLQGLVAFGQTSVVDMQAQVINDRLQELKNSLAATREWQRVGAISGKILDADGSIIYNLFDEFGVTQKSVACALDTAGTDVRKVLLDAKRHAEKRLGGFVVSAWRCYCGADFFDKLTAHPTVQAAYANYQAAADRLGGDLRKGFTYADIEFIEYNAKVSGRDFIAPDIGRLIPVTNGLFRMVNAPANYNETANTMGQAFYAKAEERRMGKGWDLEAQSNPLALCLLPEVLVELKAA